MIELTSLESLAMLSNFLVVLVAVVLVIVIVTIRRFKGLNDAVLELRKENRALQDRLETIEKTSAAEQPQEKSAKAVETVQESTPVVPMITKPVQLQPNDDAIAPEIVAAITAAIIACGYPPSAIRSIRPKRRHSGNWIMAARMAGMR